MILTIDEIKKKIRPICEKYRVVKETLKNSFVARLSSEILQ